MRKQYIKTPDNICDFDKDYNVGQRDVNNINRHYCFITYYQQGYVPYKHANIYLIPTHIFVYPDYRPSL